MSGALMHGGGIELLFTDILDVDVIISASAMRDWTMLLVYLICSCAIVSATLSVKGSLSHTQGVLGVNLQGVVARAALLFACTVQGGCKRNFYAQVEAHKSLPL